MNAKDRLMRLSGKAKVVAVVVALVAAVAVYAGRGTRTRSASGFSTCW